MILRPADGYHGRVFVDELGASHVSAVDVVTGYVEKFARDPAGSFIIEDDGSLRMSEYLFGPGHVTCRVERCQE